MNTQKNKKNFSGVQHKNQPAVERDNIVQQRRKGGKRRNRNAVKVGGTGSVSTSLVSAKTTSSNNIIPISAPTIPLTLSSTQPAVNGAALGIIAYAMQRNFPAFAPVADYPYWAYLYLSGIIQSSMQNGNVKSSTLPKFVKDMCDAVAPTHTRMANGYLAYNWDITFDATTGSYLYDLKPTGTPRTWNIGVVNNGAPVNNLWHDIGAPAAYTEANGLAAWTSLLEFYETLQVDEAQLKLVASIGPGKYRDDASAFASIGKVAGNSGTDIGAYALLASHEVPVKSPGFACFAKIPNGLTTDPARFPNYNITKSMDSIAIGGILASGFNHNLIDTKLYPVLKSIDFMRFVEVLCLWMTEAARLGAGDELSEKYLLQNVEYFTTGMTLQ